MKIEGIKIVRREQLIDQTSGNSPEELTKRAQDLLQQASTVRTGMMLLLGENPSDEMLRAVAAKRPEDRYGIVCHLMDVQIARQQRQPTKLHPSIEAALQK